MSPKLKRRATAVCIIVAASISGGSSAFSQYSVAPDPNGGGTTYQGGLWRDTTGKLWCGGTCGYGQVCCTFSPNS